MGFLFAISHRNGGGAERALSLFSSELARQGHEVFLLQADFSPQDYPVSPEVTIIPFGEQFFSQNKLSRKIHRIGRYRSVIRQIRPDAVIPFLGSVVSETFFASRLAVRAKALILSTTATLSPSTITISAFGA